MYTGFERRVTVPAAIARTTALLAGMNVSMILPASELRLCEHCHRRFPMTEFRFRSQGRGRERRCRMCRNAYEADLRKRNRMTDRDRAVAKFVLGVNRARSQQKVVALVDEILRRFGGVERFAAVWRAQLDRVRQSQPMGKKSLDFFRAVTRMAEVSEEYPPDAQELSDGDLGGSAAGQCRAPGVRAPGAGAARSRVSGVDSDTASSEPCRTVTADRRCNAGLALRVPTTRQRSKSFVFWAIVGWRDCQSRGRGVGWCRLGWWRRTYSTV